MPRTKVAPPEITRERVVGDLHWSDCCSKTVLTFSGASRASRDCDTKTIKRVLSSLVSFERQLLLNKNSNKNACFIGILIPSHKELKTRISLSPRWWFNNKAINFFSFSFNDLKRNQAQNYFFHRAHLFPLFIWFSFNLWAAFCAHEQRIWLSTSGQKEKKKNKKAAEVKRVFFLCSKFINKNKNDVIRPATALALSRATPNVFRFLFAAMFVFIPKRRRNIVKTFSLFSSADKCFWIMSAKTPAD